MTESAFRHRGLRVVVDTTEKAEFDIRGYQIGTAMMERIAGRLCAVVFSPEDRVVGDVRVRLLEGYDIIFFVARDRDVIVVTIGGVRVPDKAKPTEGILKSLGLAAILRGASGV